MKISSGSFPDLVQNELFCLTLARKVGLNVPRAEMAATQTPILVIERYDRLAGPDGNIHRLHQEDFCQALGIPPESKYENEGGPSLAQIFEALARGSQSPLPEKRTGLVWPRFTTSFAPRYTTPYPKYLRTLGLELCQKVEENAPALSGEIGKTSSGSKTLDQITQVIEKRTIRLRTELGR